MILSFFSCRQNQESFAFEIENEKIEVRLVQYSDSLYSLQLYAADSLRSEWALKYPIYRFDYGDVNGDGIPEVAVGPVKTTRFDPKPDKRLFLFKITEDLYIRPLWLGSRVGQPLEDFRLRGNPAIVRTIEREQNGTYLVAEYRYKGFGLEFEKYIKKEIGLKEAQRLLNE
jgi:hypothetical protein